MISAEDVYKALQAAMCGSHSPISDYGRIAISNRADDMKRMNRLFKNRSPVTRGMFFEIARILNEKEKS